MVSASDFRALCAELLKGLDENRHEQVRYLGHLRVVMAEARAALAEPQPLPPADGEMGEAGELVEWLRNHELDELSNYDWEALRTRAANLLECLAQSQPPAADEVAEPSQISDGYHTFAELYEHRHSLMLALMRAAPHFCWFSRRHADGELPFGSSEWFITGAELPTGAITYHLPISLMPMAQATGAQELASGKPWDGHTANDVIQRLQTWATSDKPPADGEVAEVVAWLRHGADDHWGHARSQFARAADLVAGLHAVLAELQPLLPADAEELKELIVFLQVGGDCGAGAKLTREQCRRAANLLKRLAQSQPISVAERLQRMEDLAADAVAGFRYIEQSYGRLYGVGWDRVFEKAEQLKPAPALPLPAESATVSLQE